MSIFGSILSKIFGSAPASAAVATQSAPDQPAASDAAPGAPASSQRPVDVAAVLTDMASKNGQNLNWQKSIVDLMKLLGLDSSLEQRKLLADELGYSGDTNESAAMNVWLHKQVMTSLAENGGIVPDSLKG